MDNRYKTCGGNLTSTNIDVNHAMHDAIVQNQLKKTTADKTPIKRKNECDYRKFTQNSEIRTEAVKKRFQETMKKKCDVNGRD